MMTKLNAISAEMLNRINLLGRQFWIVEKSKDKENQNNDGLKRIF